MSVQYVEEIALLRHIMLQPLPDGQTSTSTVLNYIANGNDTLSHQAKEALLPQMFHVVANQLHQRGWAVQKKPIVDAAKKTPWFDVK